MSPKACTDRILRCREKAFDCVADWLNQGRTRRIGFNLLALLISLALFSNITSARFEFATTPQLRDMAYLIGFRYSAVSLIFYGLFALIALVNIWEEFHARIENYYFWFVAVLFTCILIQSGQIIGNGWYALLQAAVCVLNLAGSLRILKSGFTVKSVALFLLYQLFLIIVLGRFEVFTESFEPWYVYSTRMVFVSTTAAAVQILKDRRSAWRHFLNPIHLINPVPMQELESYGPVQTKARVKAFMNLLSTALALKIATSIAIWVFADKIRQKGLIYQLDLLKSTGHYIYYFLGSFVAITWPVSLMRWRGHPMPEAFELPLLASSPWERWRRWNTYYYAWFFQFVFLPILRLTRSPLVGVTAVFTATFFLHIGRQSFFAFIVPPETLELILKTGLHHAIFFGAHGAAVYLGLKARFLFGDENKKSGWRGVALTWALMLLIHSLYMGS